MTQKESAAAEIHTFLNAASRSRSCFSKVVVAETMFSTVNSGESMRANAKE